VKRKLLLGAALAALVAVGVATYAWAASSADSQTLNACVDAHGNIRLVAVPGACRKGEHAISWNTVGPQGEQGPAGDTGPAGPQGPPGASASNPDVADGSVSINAQAQGAIGPFDIQGFSHEITVPHDSSSGLPTGRRQHQPITITKKLDVSTPKLLQCIATGEVLKTVTITIDEDGSAAETVTLTNAEIVDYQAHGTSESWSFDYEKIEWQVGSVVASDTWGTTTA